MIRTDEVSADPLSLLMGYAVVATDYAGLGKEGRHAYLDMLSNGPDVINSVPAAHTAVPKPE